MQIGARSPAYDENHSLSGEIILELQHPVEKPGRPTQLPERRPHTVVVRLAGQRAPRDERVVTERKPPVRVDDQRCTPLEVSLVDPKVVVEPVVWRDLVKCCARMSAGCQTHRPGLQTFGKTDRPGALAASCLYPPRSRSPTSRVGRRPMRTTFPRAAHPPREMAPERRDIYRGSAGGGEQAAGPELWDAYWRRLLASTECSSESCGLHSLAAFYTGAVLEAGEHGNCTELSSSAT